MKKWITLLLSITVLTACQLTERIDFNKEGGGKFSYTIDMSNMMSMVEGLKQDTTAIQKDTVIAFKDYIAQHKDSIAKLSAKERKRIMKYKDLKVHVVENSKRQKLITTLLMDFNSLEKVENLTANPNELTKVLSMLDETGIEVDKDEDEKQLIGAGYSFDGTHFVRDAYIKDKKRYQHKLNDLKEAKARIYRAVTYTLKYTFPREIKASSIKDAVYSLDGKTITIRRSYLEYFRNPDTLDVKITLKK